MEWYGINLNHQRQTIWLKASLGSIATIITTIILAITIALGLWKQGLQQKSINRALQIELQQTDKKLTQITQQITGLKSQDNGQTYLTLKTSELNQFLQLLKNLPIKGGLDYAQLSTAEESIKINLAGKLSPNDFSLLEQFLKQQQYPYKVEHLQTNEQHHLEFNLTLSTKE